MTFVAPGYQCMAVFNLTSKMAAKLSFQVLLYSWVSRDVINFTGGQLQIDTQSLEGNIFSLYALTLCLAANMCNFVRFVLSSAV